MCSSIGSGVCGFFIGGGGAHGFRINNHNANAGNNNHPADQHPGIRAFAQKMTAPRIVETGSNSKTGMTIATG